MSDATSVATSSKLVNTTTFVMARLSSIAVESAKIWRRWMLLAVRPQRSRSAIVCATSAWMSATLIRMTTIAAPPVAPLACGVADPKDPESTMPRNVRFKNRIWWGFTNEVGERRKSLWLSGFAESVVMAPQAWREFRAVADARGDSFAEALVKAIRLYRESDR